jgi:hypothetical protein
MRWLRPSDAETLRPTPRRARVKRYYLHAPPSPWRVHASVPQRRSVLSDQETSVCSPSRIWKGRKLP